ncbi:MAG: hypothetical protein GXP32_00555, partial [Kiritimatiellaeota bacterium]|nr:hypothetical protein [Kiritimatiellota bacterium]
MKKRTKIVLWIVISMTAVFLAVAGVAALAAAMILDDKPFPLSTRTPNGKALKSAL